MARQAPKLYEQALAELIRVAAARFDGQADFVEGSKLYSLLEAVAFQVADLSERQEASVSAAIPEAVYAAFGFARAEAVQATGALTFSAPVQTPVPVYIPAGTEAGTDDGLTFVTLSAVTLELGQLSVSAPAAAQQPGLSGNVGSGAVSRLLVPPPGIQRVSNTVPFAGGQDAETPEQQRERFGLWIDALDRSSIPGLSAALRLIDVPGIGRLTEVLVVDGETDPAIDPGTFRVYLYRAGGVPAALENAAVATVAQLRAAGCLPTITAVTGTPVGVTAALLVRRVGTTAYARAALDVYFAGLRFGEKASRENIITALTNAHPDILEVTLTLPAGDIACSPYAHLELGAVTLSETASPTGRPV